MPDSAKLKSWGLKTTLPRLRILDIFQTTETHHLSAEDVYRLLLAQGHDIGLGTVYSVLTQLHQAGLLKLARFASQRVEMKRSAFICGCLPNRGAKR